MYIFLWIHETAVRKRLGIFSNTIPLTQRSFVCDSCDTFGKLSISALFDLGVTYKTAARHTHTHMDIFSNFPCHFLGTATTECRAGQRTKLIGKPSCNICNCNCNMQHGRHVPARCSGIWRQTGREKCT